MAALTRKVQVDYPMGTTWVQEHRLQTGNKVQETYTPASPKVRLLRVPLAREERGIAASAVLQTLLQGFRLEQI